eukprot:520823-Amphidinium_carterae.1
MHFWPLCWRGCRVGESEQPGTRTSGLSGLHVTLEKDVQCRGVLDVHVLQADSVGISGARMVVFFTSARLTRVAPGCFKHQVERCSKGYFRNTMLPQQHC